MTLYPNQYDSDNELPVVDDAVTEWSGEPHNLLREAVIAIEHTLGINPEGTSGTVADRIDVSLDENGQLRPAAIAALGLLTNIMDAQIDAGANINESKLNLAYKTYTLKALIDALSADIVAVDTYVLNTLYPFILAHTNGTTARHKASYIDLDSSLIGTDGYARLATEVMAALTELNNELVVHETSTSNQHVASSVSVDSSDFTTIPQENDNVQKVITYIDNMGSEIYGEIRGVMHSNGITKTAITGDLVTSDGYNTVLLTTALPVDTIIDSDFNDKVVFKVSASPSVTANQLDALFAKISIGDYITINYGGYVSTFTINGILFEPQTVWEIKIDGINLAASTTAYAYIEQKKYDDNIFGSLAVCPANHDLWSHYSSVPSSLIVIPPRSAQAVGTDLNLLDLDNTHYLLYVDFYPEGNPSHSISLPGIDVTGNFGATPGAYTLEDIIRNTNNGFRAAGFNYRMVAFEYNGQFGLAIADCYDNAGFSIRSGAAILGVLSEDRPNNVIGDNRNDPPFTDCKDALGLGNQKGNVASPVYNANEASLPTRIFVGKKNKKYNVFGTLTDELALDSTTNTDGYWMAEVTSQNVTAVCIETTYTINQDLSNSKIRIGSTIVVLPTLARSSTNYSDYDYGRFIVKSISFTGCAPDIQTQITIISGVSILGLPLDNATPIGIQVRVYHCDDSLTIDSRNLGDTGAVSEQNTKRLHEIFINQNGNTITCERIRFSYTAAELALGGTYINDERSYGWHIINVSSKFRGYLDSTTGRRYVKLSITSYDASSKSFQAQLSENVPTTQYIGPIAYGRKDEVVRVYDDTGVDYIDLFFEDRNANMVIANPTDIVFEVFATESTNEEFMCIGSCIQTYLTKCGGISYVIDRRQFGTVNERILSNSAIEFIEANNRLLHENSIITGFEHAKTVGNTMYFSGGSANINGKIIHKNTTAFNVFPIALNGTSDYSCDIVVCVDENANFWWAPLTDDGSFGTIAPPVVSPATTTLKTYPFEYIINNRKDLMPISIVTIISKMVGTTPSLTSVTPKDVRKFVREAQPSTITVTGEILKQGTPSNTIGNFSSLDAAVEFTYRAKINKPKIIIRGVVDLNAEIILADTILEGGSYNLIRLTSSAGKISIIGNTTIQGINFERMYSVAGTNYSNSSPGNATIRCIGTGHNTYSNIRIERCNFSTHTSYAAKNVPHILFEGADSTGVIFKNITIKDNTFNETHYQLTIAFVNRSGDIQYGTVLNGIVIENNKSNYLSYMMLSSEADGANKHIGLEVYGVKIENNIFGFLWLNTATNSWMGVNNTGKETTTYSTDPLTRVLGATTPGAVDFTNFYTMLPDLVVSNNTFVAIQSKTVSGTNISYPYPVFATPSTLIHGNTGVSIHVAINGTNTGDDHIKNPGHLTISDNKLQPSLYDPYNFAPSDNIEIPAGNVMGVGGIAVFGSPNITQTTLNKEVFVNIHDNIISNPSNSISPYLYTDGIDVDVSANIHNNIISHCFVLDGIYLGFIYTLDSDSIMISVTNNTISRGSQTISSYIWLNYADVISSLKITDNVFDSPTIDGTTETPIILQESTAVAKRNNYKKFRIIRNVNQKITIDILPYISTQMSCDLTKGWEDMASIKGLGWAHMTRTTGPTTQEGYLHDQDEMAVGSIIKLSFVPNESFYLDILTLNIPFVDDALPEKINLTIAGHYMSGNKTAYLRAFGPDGVTLGTSTHDAAHELAITPDNVNINDIIGTAVEIDISSALIGNSGFDDYLGTRLNAFPIFLYFCENADPSDYTPIQLVKTDNEIGNQDDVWVKEVSATYKY